MTFEFAAVTLPGCTDPAIAIAASRADATGIVDLSMVGDPRLAVDAVHTLARFGRHRCGIRLDPHNEAMTEAIISVLRSPVDVVVLTPAAPTQLRLLADLLPAADVELWLEATTVEEARLAVDLGASTVIAKGNEAGGRVAETTTFVLLQQLLAEIGLPVWAHGGIGEHSGTRLSRRRPGDTTCGCSGRMPLSPPGWPPASARSAACSPVCGRRSTSISRRPTGCARWPPTARWLAPTALAIRSRRAR